MVESNLYLVLFGNKCEGYVTRGVCNSRQVAKKLAKKIGESEERWLKNDEDSDVYIYTHNERYTLAFKKYLVKSPLEHTFVYVSRKKAKVYIHKPRLNKKSRRKTESALQPTVKEYDKFKIITENTVTKSPQCVYVLRAFQHQETQTFFELFVKRTFKDMVNVFRENDWLLEFGYDIRKEYISPDGCENDWNIEVECVSKKTSGAKFIGKDGYDKFYLIQPPQSNKELPDNRELPDKLWYCREQHNLTLTRCCVRCIDAYDEIDDM